MTHTTTAQDDMKGETNANADSSTVPLWIAGRQLTTSATLDVIGPLTGERIWTACAASPMEAVQAIEAAHAAFQTWRRTKPAEMRNIFLKAADIFEHREAELLRYVREETGMAEAFAKFNIQLTAEMFRDVGGRVASILGAIPQTSTPGQSAFIFKEPYGVNFGIAPWNAPYILGSRAFLYALAAGNTVVLKGSELCPRTFWALGSVLQQAGLPDGVLSIIYHRTADAAAVTNTILEHPLVRKVNFTGSTLIGSIIASKAGKELKPVVMELGGKASAIVCSDADLQKAAAQVALGSFLNAGQICMATERILVHRDVIQPFSEALRSASEKLYDPASSAPTLAATAAVKKNNALLQDATAKGAAVLYGDIDAAESNPFQMRPCIISGVKRDMDIFYTESFGPTVSLITVESDEEAIDVANDTEYGLSSAVFTESLGRGLKIARALDAGAVHINSMTIHDEPTLPHGGVKKSGWGRFNAQWGVEEFLKLKTVTYVE